MISFHKYPQCSRLFIGLCEASLSLWLSSSHLVITVAARVPGRVGSASVPCGHTMNENDPAQTRNWLYLRFSEGRLQECELI